jgi:biopolymer transport protein TolR
MAMMSGQAKGPVAEMNVTPMIDLLLVLIIIFMVLAVNDKHFGEEAQIPQPPPPGKETEIPPDSTVVTK